MFVLFRGSRRITLSTDNVTVNNISLIFQVRADSVYLTADDNRGVLPGEDGVFDILDLQSSSHYEVHGESIIDGDASSSAATNQPPVRFAFHHPSSASSSATAGPQTPRASGLRMLQRNVFVAEIIDGVLETQKTVTVKFSEFDSSVANITAKVSEALGQEEPIVLIDSHQNEIMDCEGTRGPAFWKQHARKIYAVPKGQLHGLRGNKRRRESRQEDNGLPHVLEQIEEVVLASQGLQEISKTVKELIEYVEASPHTSLCLSASQAASIKAAFACIICGDPMKEPMFAECCRSILGCRLCLQQWQDNHDHCPKCRGDHFEDHVQTVLGLDEAVAALRSIIC